MNTASNDAIPADISKAGLEFVSLSLTDYGAIAAHGKQAVEFLQGQLTCDLRELSKDNWLYGAHCDNKGKTMSVFRLCQWVDQLLLIQPKSSIPESLAALKKFSVFSQVEISDVSDSLQLYGIVGEQAGRQLAEVLEVAVPSRTGQVAQDQNHLLLQLDEHPAQYLLMSTSDLPTPLQPTHSDSDGQQFWQALEIERGRPTLSAPTMLEFVPQMLNVQLLQGISFSKGCYIGQETIARMKYLGKQKRALFRLTGQGQPCTAGTTVELKLGDNWRRSGTVINAVSRTQSQLDVLAVLPSDIDAQATFRIQGDDASLLEIHSLPYELETS